MAMILQNFNLRFADPGYQLQISEALTQKPAGLRIKASLRSGIDPIKLPQVLHSAMPQSSGPTQQAPLSSSRRSTSAENGRPITILFGSSSGTCEGLAHSLASNAQGRGFKPIIRPLDEAVDDFPSDQPVVIIVSSYEGLPPDNAKIFLEWLKTTNDPNLSEANFAVFGCGHRDWVSTYQRVPTTIGKLLVDKGATALIPRGETDVSKGTIFDDFDSWTDSLAGKLCADIEDTSTGSGGFNVHISTNARVGHLRYNHMQGAKVISNARVTAPDAPEKRHLTIKLPTDLRYEPGDYLAVLPINNSQTISRVLRRFSLPWDAVMTITEGSHAAVPANTELSVAAVLGSYVELSMPATRKNKEVLTKCMEDDLSDNNLSGSVLDILERHPDMKLSFATFLGMLPPLRLRQYSMSSSPLADPTTASITFSVLESGKHLGTATNYLKELEPGSTIHIAIKKCSNAFRLPLDDTVPVIMVCAGSGIAPFRGFIHERAVKRESGKHMGEAILFVGCRGEGGKLFAEELAQWEAKGVVKVFRAYSRQPELTKGCKYVQDRLWAERELASRLFDQGARAYVCGSSKIGQGVSEVAAKIAIEGDEKEGKSTSYEEALKWWQDLRGDRYAVDVFD